MVTFASSPLVVMLMALSHDFGSNHDWDCLRIDHGWYDQQQHILTVVPDPWDLKVDIHKPEVWGGRTPVPLSSNN